MPAIPTSKVPVVVTPITVRLSIVDSNTVSIPISATPMVAIPARNCDAVRTPTVANPIFAY